MIRAVWNGVVLADAEHTMMVEGNHYFPADALRREHCTGSDSWTLCPWKGVARYYDVTVDGQTYPDVVWYYPRPTPLARRIKDRVAFHPGVGIERTEEERSARGGAERQGGSAPDRDGRGWLRALLGGRA